MSSSEITSSDVPQFDATPSYRGYRLQALYTLSRVLEDSGDDDLVYQPEDLEDLAVYNAQQDLLEIIQVKQRSQNLVLSSFEPEKKDSFFHRVSTELKTAPNARISIVAFGKVGPELQKAIYQNGPERARMAGKVAKYGYISEIEATSLLDNTHLLLVDEHDLMNRVFAVLASSLAGVDPHSAFDLLTYWLYLCSEKKTKITRQEVIERVNAVGRFATSRAAYHKEWFTSIVPLERRDVTETRQRDELLDEFYRGTSTRYEHILADLDGSDCCGGFYLIEKSLRVRDTATCSGIIFFRLTRPLRQASRANT